MTTTRRITVTITAVILSIIVLALALFGFVFAFADEGGKVVTDNMKYNKLYYFSDYDGCENYCNAFLLEYLNEYKNEYPDFDSEIELHDWSKTNLEKVYGSQEVCFADMLTEYYNSEEYKAIENSFIIFEMRERMPIDVVDDGSGSYSRTMINPDFLEHINYRIVDSENDVLSNILLNMFQELRYNNCKILVISGTDECAYEEGNSYNNGWFLDCAHMHINLDIFYSFITQVLENIRTQSNFENCTIALDSSLSNPEFFFEYLFPYINDVYELQVNPEPYLSDDLYYWGRHFIERNAAMVTAMEFFNERNVNFIVDDDVYKNWELNEYKQIFDIQADCIFGYSEGNDPYFLDKIDVLRSNWVYAIGTTYYNGKNFDTWEELAQQIKDYSGASDIYAYLYRGFEFDDEACALHTIDNVYTVGERLIKIDEWLPEMIYDFIMGYDLMPYNNYLGICAVSHIAMAFSDNGWMHYPQSAIGSGKRVMSLDGFVDMYGGINIL